MYIVNEKIVDINTREIVRKEISKHIEYKGAIDSFIEYKEKNYDGKLKPIYGGEDYQDINNNMSLFAIDLSPEEDGADYSKIFFLEIIGG